MNPKGGWQALSRLLWLGSVLACVGMATGLSSAEPEVEAEAAVAAILALSPESDGSVEQEAAILRLARLGGVALPAVRRGLTTSVAGRRDAVRPLLSALVLMRGAASPVVGHIAAMLPQFDGLELRAALTLFREVHSTSPETRTAIVSRLRVSVAPDEQVTCLQALGALGGGVDGLLGELRPFLLSKVAAVRWETARAMYDVAPEREEAVRPLAEMARADASESVRRLAYRLMGERWIYPSICVPILLLAAEQRAGEEAVEAAKAVVAYQKFGMPFTDAIRSTALRAGSAVRETLEGATR